MLEGIQDTLSDYLMWLIGIMVLLGLAQVAVPTIAPTASMVNAFVGAIIAFYFIAYGESEGFNFKLDVVAAYGLVGFVLLSVGVTGITGAFGALGSVLGPAGPFITAIAAALAAPVGIVGGSLILLALLGIINSAK